MKKLTNLLKESNFKPEMGKVYSNLYAKSFIKENDEESDKEQGLSDEQKAAFYEAVKQYRKFGESVYRNAGLSEVYEAIKNMVETASKVTISETGDWFDNVTVSRHMKRMGESFNIFEKTLKEVSTLQQRLEASYDEIGEVLGKYYEINEMEDEIEEGNAFSGALNNARNKGQSSFEFDGKTYPVEPADGESGEGQDGPMDEQSVNKQSMKLTDMVKKPSVNEAFSDNKNLNALMKGRKITNVAYDSNLGFAVILDNGKYIQFDAHSARPGQSKDMKFESVNEGASTEEKRIAMLAARKIAKYRNVPISQSVVDVQRAASELESDIKKGKIKSESVNEGKYDDTLDKLADIVKDAKSFMDIGSGLKKAGIKYSFGTSPLPMYIIDKPAKIAILNNKYADGAERVVGTTAIGLMEGMVTEAKYDIGMARKGNGLTIYNKAEEEAGDYKNIAHIDNRGNVKFYDKKLPNDVKKKIEAEAQKMKESKTEGTKMIKLKNLLNESFGMGELPSSKLMKMKVSAKDMLDSVNPKKVNESSEEDVVEEGRVSTTKLLQSVVNGETSRVEGIKLSKEMAQSFIDWIRLSPYGKKYGDLPFYMLFKASFNWGLNRHADKKSKEYKELEAKAKEMAKKK